MNFPLFSKHAATLKFALNEILDDIKNYAYIEGDTMQRDNEHAKHQVFDVAETGNIDRVTRVLDLTFARCVEICYPYAERQVCCYTSRDNELEMPREYIMKLRLPSTFSETSITLLEKLIHELLVYRVMEDWMTFTKPESVSAWKDRAEKMESEIKHALNGRTRSVRRRMSPF